LTETLAHDKPSRLARCVEEAHTQLRSKPTAEALFDRAFTAFMRELLGMTDLLAARARNPELIGQDDKTLLAELLIQALQANPLASKQTRLRLQGQLALRRLLEEADGTCSTAEVATLLNITEDAVRKRTRKGKLLSVPHGEHSVYPAFQFDADGVVKGLEAILPLLQTDSAPAKVRFFLSADSDLGGPPIETLRTGDAAARALVARKARQFARHTAR